MQDIDSFILCKSCDHNHNCCLINNAPNTMLHPDPFSGSQILYATTSPTFFESWVWEGVLKIVSFRVEYSTVPYSQKFDQLCVSPVTAAH